MGAHAPELLRGGSQFSSDLGTASGNPLIRSMAGVVEAALVASSSQSSPVDDPADHEHTVNTHAQIVDAIEARDEQAAAAATLKVIDIGYRRVNGRKRSVKR